MTVQKFITYKPFDINGQNQLDSNHELKLSVLRRIWKLFIT